MLKYNLVENLLTAAPDDYMAQATQVTSYSIEQIAERMLDRGTLLTKADILAVLEVYQTEIAKIIAEGNGINTPLFNALPGISGVFNNAGDNFDASRHKVRININAGILLREAVSKVRVEKIQVIDPIPYIIEVKDIVSRSTNENLTPGGVVQIRGSRLKFNEEKADNGVFLVKDDGTPTRCDMIVENKPARIIAMLPATLSSGSYTLEVRTTLAQNNSLELKQMKIGRFAKTLNV